MTPPASRRGSIVRGLLAVLLGVAALEAGAVEQELLGGRVAKFHVGRTTVRGVVRFAGDAVLAQLPDPRDAAGSAVRLATQDDVVQEMPLVAAGWKRTRDGFRYAHPAGAPRSAIVGVALSPRGLEIRFRGPRARVRGPVAGLDVGLQIGDRVVCGRFTRFGPNRRGRVQARGPSERCRAPRPNLLLVVLDDARADGVDRMPVLQARVAGEGRSFANAFTPHASCCPSRASLLTGQYALRHGTYQVSGPIGGADTFRANGTDQHTIAVALRAAGYRTGLFGKYLNAYGLEGGFGPGGGFYVPPGWDRWWALVSEHYGGVHGASYEVADARGATTTFADEGDDATYSTDLSARRLRDFVLEAHAARRPFFAVWAPVAPHGEIPGIVPAPAARHFGSFARLPPWRPVSRGEVDVADKPRWVQALQDTMLRSPRPALLPAFTDAFRIRQYEALLAVDEQLGLILDQLDALDIASDTVVIVTSDNGIGWGEHHLWARKSCPYEECQRVPFTVRYPRRLTRVPSVDAMPVVNIDVAPTLADLGGVTLARAPDGQSLLPWLADVPRAPGRAGYMMEHWRVARGDEVRYTGQVADGDRLRVYFGPTRAQPRARVSFEFDGGDGVAGDAVPVAIGVDATASLTAFASAVRANVPGVLAVVRGDPPAVRLVPTIVDGDVSVSVWEEADGGGVMAPTNDVPDYLGLRDVAGGYTWVEYETGERELYDLHLDPAQMENRADDPGYAEVRAGLAGRLEGMVAEIRARP